MTEEPCFIQLSQGKVALVDLEDWLLYQHLNWTAAKNSISGKFYAVRRSSLPGRPLLWLHREVLGLSVTSQDPRHVDHANRDTLDCRRANLRIATRFQNAANKDMRTDNTSGVKGVYRHKANGKWIAQITAGGRQRYLGSFTDIDLAHEAYRAASADLHGEFGVIARRGELCRS